MSDTLRLPAEQTYAAEIAALIAGDAAPKPEGWAMSPQAVVTYLMGGQAADGTEITAKYVGKRRLIETAVATLATDRALLLLGVPGTAKSWVSEHLATAVSGDSTMVIQCTAGTDENQVRYSWNYAQLLADILRYGAARAIDADQLGQLFERIGVEAALQLHYAPRGLDAEAARPRGAGATSRRSPSPRRDRWRAGGELDGGAHPRRGRRQGPAPRRRQCRAAALRIRRDDPRGGSRPPRPAAVARNASY